MTTTDRSDIVGFRDGSPIRRHPDHDSAKPMTKTEARKHLADAKRALGGAQYALKTTPAWMVREGVRDLTPTEREHQFRTALRRAEAALAALREYSTVAS